MATTQTGTGTSDMRGMSGTMGSSTSGGMHASTGMNAGSAVSDPTYDLISVMYHTLQGCQTYERYAQDAEQAGQQDLAQFFRETGQQFERCAERGRQLLAQCLQKGPVSQGGRSGQQLSSQMGSSGRQGQLSSGSQGPGGSPGQQSQMGTSRGQQGSSGYGSRGASLGSSGSTNMGSSGSSSGDSNSALEGGTGGSSGSRSSGSRANSRR